MNVIDSRDVSSTETIFGWLISLGRRIRNADQSPVFDMIINLATKERMLEINDSEEYNYQSYDEDLEEILRMTRFSNQSIISCNTRHLPRHSNRFPNTSPISLFQLVVACENCILTNIRYSRFGLTINRLVPIK